MSTANNTDIRLYLMDCGTLDVREGPGAPYSLPVQWYLITHPRGHIVIDGGNAAAAAVDPATYWGPISEVAWPLMTPDHACIPQLRAIGIDPADVRWIVQTHLHIDHTGAVTSITDL